ncbi:MAG: lipocalin family protein [Campylobacterales bacterium]
MKDFRSDMAQYIMKKSRLLALADSCYDDAGRLKDRVEGKAYVVEGSGNAKLRVTFFWPFYGDYWVIMLADDYRYSVVGDPKRKYLWILARDTVLSDADRNAIMSKLVELGYDPFKLYWTGFKAMCTH